LTLLERLGYKPATVLIAAFVPPLAGRLAAMLQAADYDNLNYALRRLHPDSVAGTLAALINVLDQTESRARWLERLWQWYRRQRDIHSMSALIVGLLHEAGASHQRTALDALPARRREVIAEDLAEAERLLDKACQQQPGNADLLALRLLTARYLALPPSEHWVRFRLLLAVAAEHFRGHLLMLENLGPDWYGSAEAMFRFARARAAQVPAHHPLCGLPVYAHFAMHRRQRMAEDAALDQWFAQPDVAVEVLAIWESLRESLALPGRLQEDELLNLLAGALYLSGHSLQAGEALTIMDGRCLPMPWCQMAMNDREAHNPGWVVDRIRAEIAEKSSANSQ
jgi:hypothetical protein